MFSYRGWVARENQTSIHYNNNTKLSPLGVFCILDPFVFFHLLLCAMHCMYNFIFLCLFVLRPSQKSLEHKETAEQELLMKGPGTFPLERLLAIFQCLTSIAEGSIDEEEQGNEGLGVQGGDGGLMSDVLLQLSSLCNANFIIKGGSCPLEGSTRYRSTVCEDIALEVIFVLSWIDFITKFYIKCRFNTVLLKNVGFTL